MAAASLGCASVLVALQWGFEGGFPLGRVPGGGGPSERSASSLAAATGQQGRRPRSYLCCDIDSPWRCVTGNESPGFGELRRIRRAHAEAEGGVAASVADGGAAASTRSLRPPPLRIGFVSYATGPYNAFAEELWESIRHHAFPGHEVHLFLFTDRAEDEGFLPHPLVHKRLQERLGWPFDSLGRHFLYLNASDWFAGMDYVLAIDSDAKVVGSLDELMLGERMATLQAWSFGRPRNTYKYEGRWTPAGDPYSAGFVAREEGMCYFCGGLFGGTLRGFIEILEASVALARRDLQASPPRVALWHDESYLNRVFIDRPPTIVLAPNFMYPEPPMDEWLYVQEVEEGRVAWTASGKGGGRRFRHKIYNLGVRKHITSRLKEYQPLTASVPALMSGSGEAESFPLPLPRTTVASLVTFLIKAFERPSCLTRLLDSIGKAYPGFNIIVLDDSAAPLLSSAAVGEYETAYGLHITYLPTETDLGLSEGRNRLVDAAKTPYVLLLDDDFILRDDGAIGTGEAQAGGKLAALVSALEYGDFDLAGGCVDSTQGSAWSYGLARYRGALRQTADVSCRLEDGPMPRLPDYSTDEIACWQVDTILNFFLARADFLRKVRWDPVLKVGEHEDFFLRAKDAGGRVAMCRGFVGQNDNTCDATPAYKAKRKRVFDFWVHMFRKHSITRMQTAAGTYTLDCPEGAAAAAAGGGEDGSGCTIKVQQDHVWFD